MSKRFEKWGTTEIIQDKRYAWSLEKICDYLNENLEKITDLEAKLAESEKNVEFYKERYSDATTSAYGADLMAKDYQWHLEKEIEELKQQLAEKEHSIGMLNQHLTDKAIEIERLGEELAEKEKEIRGFEARERARLFKVDQQDKIELLEKVKKEAKHYGYEFSKSMHEYIDTLIKDIKGE